MITEDQTDVLAFIGAPSTHAGAAVERIDTHASVVFLAGDRAWKLKRAVKYDYLDFSTADRRREMCEAEVRLNRRTAPSLYLRAVAITRQPDGSLAIGGSGSAIDWVIEMARFDQENLFDRLAASGRLDPGLMHPLAGAIAQLHEHAEHRPDRGGRAGMEWVIDGNETGFAHEGRGILDPDACARLIDRSRAALEQVAPQLEDRRASGLVRYCHGDLHLRNIVLLDGRPTLFDAVEFNENIACTDILYDLAFLLMDLWRRRLPAHANAVWNAYLAATAQYQGASLLPLFLSCRAAVRAKTSATSATIQVDQRRGDELRSLAREYLAMAADLLSPPSPALIAIGGLSGSGKSSLAAALAPLVGAPPGAIVLRSDVIRKQLLGVPEQTRLGPDGYTPDVSRRVYETMAHLAAEAARAGQTAIADAVFAREPDRLAIEHVARDQRVPFTGVWLDAPEALLIERTERRDADVSDADGRVVQMQAREDIGVVSWLRLDASPDRSTVLRRAVEALRGRVELRTPDAAHRRH